MSTNRRYRVILDGVDWAQMSHTNTEKRENQHVPDPPSLIEALSDNAFGGISYCGQTFSKVQMGISGKFSWIQRIGLYLLGFRAEKERPIEEYVKPLGSGMKSTVEKFLTTVNS